MDAEDILNGLIRGAMSSRGKRWDRAARAVGVGGSLVNAQTLLAAAGVAWGLYETWQSQQAGRLRRPRRCRVGAAPQCRGPGPPPPLPPPAPGAAASSDPPEPSCGSCG